jgi:hypothetical protein
MTSNEPPKLTEPEIDAQVQDAPAEAQPMTAPAADAKPEANENTTEIPEVLKCRMEQLEPVRGGDTLCLLYDTTGAEFSMRLVCHRLPANPDDNPFADSVILTPDMIVKDGKCAVAFKIPAGTTSATVTDVSGQSQPLQVAFAGGSNAAEN